MAFGRRRRRAKRAIDRLNIAEGYAFMRPTARRVMEGKSAATTEGKIRKFISRPGKPPSP